MLELIEGCGRRAVGILLPNLRKALNVSRHLFLMFNIFKNSRQPICPVDRETRIWMEGAFLWLCSQFSEQTIVNMRTLVPHRQDFPFSFDGSQKTLVESATIVAAQMNIDIDKVNLQTYQDSIREIKGEMGYSLYPELDPSSEIKLSGGMYFGKGVDGRFTVYIEQSLLFDPEGLIATLAHEFAHIKLLGENRIETNHEDLTDLTTVAFGLGIFNANSSSRFNKNYSGWSHSALGYLTQQEWGYGLALYAYYREEQNPSWIKYLTPNLKTDFKKSQEFMYANMDKIFIEE